MKITQRILILLLTLVVMAQCFVIPVSAEARDPYTSFMATSYDELYNGSSLQPITVLTDRVGTMHEGSWIKFKDLDFGKGGPYKVDIETTAPQGCAKVADIRIDSPTGPVLVSIPITPSSGWGVGLINSAEIKTKITGVHDVYVSASGVGALAFRSMCFYTSYKEEVFEYQKYSPVNNFTDLDGESCQDIVNMLCQLGIIPTREDGLYKPDKKVSRGEFAYSIYRMYEKEKETTEDEEAVEIKTSFADVSGDSQYAEAIEYLAQFGIMNGVSESEFKPSSYISYMDAQTVLIRVLGYKELAESNGGYPTGYIKAASRLKLMPASVDINSYVSKADMALMLYSALEAENLTAFSVVDGVVKYEKGEGILGATQNAYQGSGKIKATAISIANMPDSGLDKKQVDIDGQIYLTGNTDAIGLLGFECDFWYEENGGERVLRAIAPSPSTEFTEISSAEDEIVEIKNDEITYILKGEDKERTIDVSNDTYVIYNGVAASEKLVDLLKSRTNYKGTIGFAENHDGSTVLVIEEYSDYIVDSIDGTTNAMKVRGLTDTVDLDGNKNFVFIKGEDGKDVKTNKIAVGQIVTVYQSANSKGPKLVRVNLSTASVSGSVTKIYGDEIYINDTVYEVSNNCAQNITLGMKGRFDLNIYGEIVRFEAGIEAPPEPGLYIAHTAQDTGFEKRVSVKLVAKDGKVHVYPVAEKLTYNGKKFDGMAGYLSINVTENGVNRDAGLNGLEYLEVIRYRLNSDGKVSMIDTKDEIEGGPNDTLIRIAAGNDSIRFSSSSQTLYNAATGTLDTFFAADGTVFRIFENEDIETACTVGTMSMIPSLIQLKNVHVYSSTGSKHVGDILVNNRTINAIDYKAPMIVDDIVTAVDANGDTVKLLKGYEGGDKVEYVLTDDFLADAEMNSVFTNICKGDVVRVKPHKNNEIMVAQLVALRNGETMAERSGLTVAPKVSTDNRADGEKGELDYRFVLGTVAEKADKYMLVSTGGEKQELIAYGSADIAMVYARDDGSYIVSTGNNPSAIGLTDTVLACYHNGKIVQIIIYDAAAAH